MKRGLSFGVFLLALVSVSQASDISQPGVKPPAATPPPSEVAVCVIRVIPNETIYQLAISQGGNSFIVGAQRMAPGDHIKSFAEAVAAAERLIHLRVCGELKVVSGRE